MPDLKYEKRYLRRGYKLVIGVDEVGRGAFAGPVVAAAVAVRIENYELKSKNHKDIDLILGLGIDDSKKLTAKKRESLIKEIRKYFDWGIGEASVADINRSGIVKATEKAMRKAISELRIKNQELGMKKKRNSYFLLPNSCFLLVDAFHVKYIPGIGLPNQKGIIHGDGKSVSIAAASILAKVYRDKLMVTLGKKYKRYKWHENKGYGTLEHRKAIKKYGICCLHREKFTENWI